MTADEARQSEQHGHTLPDEGFVAYGATPELRDAVRKGLEQSLATAGPDFGDAMRETDRVFRRADPIALMGAVAMYYGTAEAGTNPEFTRTDGVFWHHMELAQAFAFRSIPAPSYDLKPPFEVIEDVTRALTRLSDAWIVLEARKFQQAPDGPERDLAGVLSHLRVNAMAVRGWGYADRMVPLLEDLLRPLDSAVYEGLGWRPSALPGWWVAMIDALNERLEAHRKGVREAAAWSVDDDWLTRVRERFAVLAVDDEQTLVAAAAADEELRRAFVYHSSDLCAHEIFRYRLDELVELFPGGGVAPETVRGILDAWSLAPGDDGGVERGQLFLENPVVGRPFVASGSDEWHLFCTWLLVHNPFELVERLLEGDLKLFDAYLSHRTGFLEERVGAVLAHALPAARVETRLLHIDPRDGREYENDALALLDSYVVVAEAKAGRLGPDVRRGKGRQLRDRIADLLDKPSEQAERLAKVLVTGSGEETFRRKVDGSELKVDASGIRRALILGVTLEPLAGLLPRLRQVAEAGLSERTADALAYSISLPDLELVTDVLKHPSEVLHYLGRRAELERRTFLRGGESDLLGLYLQTGFNLGEQEFEDGVILNVTGMSDPIDLWHYRNEAGMEAERPRVERTPWWEATLTRVESRQVGRWPEIGVTLCNVGLPEQQELERAMRRLRTEVVSGDRPATDIVVFLNGPPQRRDLFVGVIAFSTDRAERAEHYEHAAHVAMREHDLERVIVLAWTPAPMSIPYFALIYYERERSSR